MDISPNINDVPLVPLDFTKAPEQLVIDMINNDNGTTLTTDQLTFGIPELSNGKHNSTVLVKAIENSKLKGSALIHYNRVDIGEIPNGRSTTFPVTTEVNLSDLVPAIDTAYNLRLTPADYINTALPSFSNIPNEELTVDLVAANTSLIFINKLTLTVKHQVLLSNILNKLILNGLNYIAPAFTY
jgi:hypothetical protein